MLDVCMKIELAVMNTQFKKTDVHKYTQVRVDGGRVVRVLKNYIVKSKRMCGRMLHVNVLQGVNGGMYDHYLVEGKLTVGDR